MKEKGKSGRLWIENLAGTHAWPEAMKAAFDAFVKAGDEGTTHVVLAVCLDIESKRLSTVFSPAASLNLHKVDMCKDMSEMFLAIAARLTQ